MPAQADAGRSVEPQEKSSFKAKSRGSISSKKSTKLRQASSETDNFDTMMETPGALRFASQSFHSDDGRRSGKKRGSTKLGGQGACCTGPESGGCTVF